MPEGPELRRSADQLQCLVNRRVATLTVLGGRYRDRFPDGLLPFLEATSSRFIHVAFIGVKGKFMWWRFYPDWVMWCTYGMSGQWSFERGRHSAVGIVLTDGETSKAAYFNDPRRFSTLRFVFDPTLMSTLKKLETLGPDMLHRPPTSAEFQERLLMWKPQRTLAEALMDQRCVSGVGNYAKAESLWSARLSPHRTCDSLSLLEIGRLRDCTNAVLVESYRSGGATISTYRNVDGSRGGAQSRFAVYGHKVDPLGNPVVKERTKDGRTTWWCPAIQG